MNAGDSAGGETRVVLKGHSGAQILLLHSDHKTRVRKIAIDPSFNERLRQQCDKLTHFTAQGVRAPAVLADGFIDGRFYFDMAYIVGASIAHEVIGGLTVSNHRLGGLIADWHGRVAKTTDGMLDADVLAAKVESVLKRSVGHEPIASLRPRIAELGTLFSRVAWPRLPRTDFHGDFTLENMLVDSEGKIQLIDFDAADIPSFWMDFGKLYQDLMGHWCIRSIAIGEQHSLHYRNATAALHLFRLVADPVLRDITPEILPHLPALAALNLLRTLPYCTDPATGAYVCERISAVLSEAS